MERSSELKSVDDNDAPNPKVLCVNNIKDELPEPTQVENTLNESLVSLNQIKIVKKVLTEDLGKIFERAICLLYEIDFDGTYKYGLEEPTKLKDRIQKLKEVFPYQIKHIAKNGSQFDFVSIDNNLYLSAKTTKKDGKVCPQVIGQPSKKKFCEYFHLDYSYSLEQIKMYIQENVSKLLETYSSYTFDCPIIYYNKHKNLVWYVNSIENINWNNQVISFSHIVKNNPWNESSSILINNITIGEFQLHKHRDCIKFRWSFEKLLSLFKNNFKIILL
jgi:hypothetical protein